MRARLVAAVSSVLLVAPVDIATTSVTPSGAEASVLHGGRALDVHGAARSDAGHLLRHADLRLTLDTAARFPRENVVAGAHIPHGH
jgi:hypothetical protein